VQILVGKGLTRGKRTNAVKGTLDIGAALGRLLYGTGLEVVATSGTVITLGQRDRSGQAGAVRHPPARHDPCRGTARARALTRRSTAVVDAVRYDDVSTLAGSDGSVVEQLVTLPGVTGIEEGDTRASSRSAASPPTSTPPPSMASRLPRSVRTAMGRDR
jgi:hypothetical protein